MTYQAFDQKQYVNDFLGNEASYPLSQYGCVVTDIASICVAYGKQTDPSRLNKDLISVDGYAPNAASQKTLMRWDKINAIYPDITLGFNNAYPSVPADMNLIDAQLAKGHPVIVGVSFQHDPKSTDPNHYVVLFEKTATGVYQAMDPWGGTIINFSSSYAVSGMSVAQCILQAIVYSFTPVVVPVAVVAQPVVSDESMKLIDEMRQARDNNWNMYKAETEKNALLARDLDGSRQASQLQNSDLIASVTALEGENKTLKDENTGLKVQIKQVSDQNANIAGLYKQATQADATAIDVGMKAEKQRDELVKVLNQIAGTLGTNPDAQHILSEISLLIKTKRDVIKSSINYVEQFLSKLGLGSK